MEKTQRQQENRLIFATLFVFAVSGASSMLMGNLLPILQKKYGFSDSYGGLLTSLPSWGNLASIFITGYLPALIGRRKTVLLTATWMGVALAIIASGLGAEVLLPVACVFIGIARGGNTNFSNTMMSTLPGSRAAVGYNLLHGAFAVGAVLSPVLLVLCSKQGGEGWRYMVWGVVAFCVIQAVVYATMRLPRENITGSIKAVDKSFLKNRNFWLAAAILFFYISTEYAIVNWLVSFFIDERILSADTSQLMSSLLWVVIFAGRMLGAYLVGKVSRKIILVVDGIGLFVCFLVVFFGRSQLPIFLGIMGVGLSMATIYTSALALGTKAIRGNDLGVSTMILIGSSGGVITPLLVGVVSDIAGGKRYGMAVVVVVTALLLATILYSVLHSEPEEE